MQKITPFLWFDDQAEEAARFYTSLFEDSRIIEITHYTEGGPRPAGSVMTVHFQLHGQDFIALNGGPQFRFSEAVSMAVRCEDQAEVDRLWEKLAAGGTLADERVLGDAAAAADATGLDAVGVTGFCIGGHLAWRAALLEHWRAMSNDLSTDGMSSLVSMKRTFRSTPIARTP